MLNNIINFFNLIAKNKIKSSLDPTDLIPVGTRDSRYVGKYQPTTISFSDLKKQIGNGGSSSVDTDGVTIIGDGTPGNPLVAVTPTTTIVNIPSAQILAMGTTPIQLLPDLIGDKMYEYSIILYQNNASATESASFGVSTGLWVGDSVRQRGSRVTAELITETIVTGLDVPSDRENTNNYLNNQFPFDKKVILTSFNGSDPNQNLSADVTLKAIITYKIIDLI